MVVLPRGMTNNPQAPMHVRVTVVMIITSLVSLFNIIIGFLFSEFEVMTRFNHHYCCRPPNICGILVSDT